jgi:hypothetical protein
MKHSRQVRAAAPPEVVFDTARTMAAATENSGVEAKANTYVRYTVGENVGVDFAFSPVDGGTLIDCTTRLKYGAGEAWSGGILTPLIAPGYYLMVRRLGRKLSDGLKSAAETEAISAGHKLGAYG